MSLITKPALSVGIYVQFLFLSRIELCKICNMLLGGLGEIEEINSCGKQNLLNVGLGKVLITKQRFSQINGKSVNKRQKPN